VILSSLKKENKFLIDIKMLNRTLKLQSTQNNFIKEQIKTLGPEDGNQGIGHEGISDRIVKFVQEENEYEVQISLLLAIRLKYENNGI
jgi:hypothetical protein